MALYYVTTSAGTVPQSYLDQGYTKLVYSNPVTISDNSTYVIAPNLSGNVAFQPPNDGVLTDPNHPFTIKVDSSNANLTGITVNSVGARGDLIPTLQVADGVNIVNANVYFQNSDGSTINIGNNASIGNITGGDEGTILGAGDADKITIGNGASVGTIFTGDGYDTLIGGQNVTYRGAVTMTGNLAQYDQDQVTIGDGSTVTGNLFTGASADSVTIGNNVKLNGGFDAGTQNDNVTVNDLNFSQLGGSLTGNGDFDNLTIRDPNDAAGLRAALQSNGWTRVGNTWTGGSSFTYGTTNISGWESITIRDLVVDGTALGDTIGPGYTDIDGDQIDGSDGLNDVIRTLAGNDSVNAGVGADTVYAGTGDDTVDGGAGNDVVYGYGDTVGGSTTEAGNDVLIGNLGDDKLYGGAGDDKLYGDDTLGSDTAGGADSLDGGTGNDSLYGGYGNDTLLGGDGIDILQGGDGADSLDGGNDADNLSGGAGNDALIGGAGNDTLDGGAGNDSLTGGAGDDRFVAGSGDIIFDFNAGNTGAIDDGDQTNNDFVDLSSYYSGTIDTGNLGIINAARIADGLPPYRNPLAWLRGDQADGVLNDVSTANGFAQNFTLTINNGGAPVAAEQLTFDNTNVMCFAGGTLIETDEGMVAIEELCEGDLVLTRDNGSQPIRWIGSRALSGAELADNLRPIRIRRHALGTNVPSSDLLVSPQHRVLVRSKIAQKMFGTDEVLVAAKQLCQLEGIDIADDVTEVQYFHMLFDRHEVVISNGAETESLYTGPEALKSVGREAREEIFALFPELADRDYTPVAARTLASGRMGRKLAVRHAQHNKPLVS